MAHALDASAGRTRFDFGMTLRQSDGQSHAKPHGPSSFPGASIAKRLFRQRRMWRGHCAVGQRGGLTVPECNSLGLAIIGGGSLVRHLKLSETGSGCDRDLGK